MTRPEGTILGDDGLEPTLTPAQLISVYTQIGKLLCEFHRIPMNAFTVCGYEIRQFSHG